MRQRSGRLALLRDGDGAGECKKADLVGPKPGRRYLCRNENEYFEAGALPATECPYCGSPDIVEIVRGKQRKEDKNGG